jgi:hypothetical protein
MPINKFTTLLDLSRQSKIITGETATFDGKIQAGIPFSGYPTGVDTATTVSLGVVSNQTAVFSGDTGTTVFDVSNPSSPNYNPIFDSFSANTWTNPLFGIYVSGLTLPITPLSADTQTVGPFWTLTQTGYTGEYVIGTQYTGYSISYSFVNLSSLNTGSTLFSGFTIASQQNFSAGTLDYKGPLDYISSKENITVDGRLITNKITITNGASSATTNYVLTSDEFGNGSWQESPSFSGGSGNCISDLYISNIHSCSPLNINPLDEGNVYFGSTSGVTVDVSNNRLGIGTSSPATILDVVNGTSRFSYDPINTNIMVSGGNTSLTFVEARISGTSVARMGIRGTTNVGNDEYGKINDAFLYSSISNNGLNVISASGTGTEDYIRFYAGQNADVINIPDIHIQGSGPTRGFVGINNSSPTELLHLKSTGAVRVKLEADTDNLDETHNVQLLLSQDGGVSTAVFGITPDTNNNLVVGVNSNTTPNIHFGTRNDGTSFVTTTDTKMIITNVGNVGIGTETPSEKLDVSGKTKTINFQMTSGATPGYVLTSDASGNASWQVSSGGGAFTGGTVTGTTNFTNGLSATTISATTIGSSGDCIDNIYVSNIHSCSPLNINPLDEGNVYFGSTSGITIDITNNRIGVNGSNPTKTLDVKGETLLSGNTTNVLNIIGSGSSTTEPIVGISGSSGQLFTIKDSLVGSLFSVNNISSIPVLEVFDNDTVLMGNFSAPGLYSSVKSYAYTGLTNIHFLPMSAYTGAWYEYTVINNITPGLRTGQIMAVFSGNTVNYIETSTSSIGTTSGISFSFSADNNSCIFQSSANTTGFVVKTIIRSI